MSIITKEAIHVIDFCIVYFATDWKRTADWLLGRSEKGFDV
jgi:hypothetical protein